MNILNQRDPLWVNDKLGTSNTTIGGFGCTITCLAMASNLTPPEVNNKLNAVSGYANGNLVIWSKIVEAIPWLKFEWRGYTYENDKVSEAITKNGFCLVEVDGSRIGGTKHWCLYIGGGQMYDPFYGTQKSTGYYPAIGYAIINKIGEPVMVNTDLQTQIISLQKEIEDKNKQITSYADQVAGWEKKYEECNTQRIEAGASADGFRKQLNEFVATLANILGTRQETSEIIASIETAITFEDKATELTRRIELEEREHHEAISTLESKIKALESNLESLKADLKAVKDGSIPPLVKKSILELLTNIWEKIWQK
jgi:hypothetical protein